MKISKNSWLYRIGHNFNYKTPPQDLCNYMKWVAIGLFNLILSTILAISFGLVIVTLVYVTLCAVFQNPVHDSIFLSIVVPTLTILFFGFCFLNGYRLSEHYEYARKYVMFNPFNKLPKPKKVKLLSTYLKSIKDKTCIKIEYKD